MRIDRVALATELAKADISLKTLATRSGLSRSTITAVRSGKSCTEATATKLAEGLGVSLFSLTGKEEARWRN